MFFYGHISHKSHTAEDTKYLNLERIFYRSYLIKINAALFSVSNKISVAYTRTTLIVKPALLKALTISEL